MSDDTSSDRTSEQQSPIPEQTGKNRFEAGDELNKALKEEYDRRESEKSDTGYRDVGKDPTLPGQEELIAGSPEHERKLKAYPQATMYGPDVNVVEAPPPEPPQQEGEEEKEENEDDCPPNDEEQSPGQTY